MDEMALDVKQNVAVMAIFNLQDIAYEAIGSQTVAEVVLRFLVSVWLLLSKLEFEVVDDHRVRSDFLLNTMNAERIWDYLNQSTVWTCG